MLRVAGCLGACAKDPAASVKISLDGLTDGTHVGHDVRRGATRLWRPELCPPQPETLGESVSTLVFGGPCAFEHHGLVQCRIAQDDMHLLLTRSAADGASVNLIANVERYRGPGRYEETQTQMIVADRGTLFRWSNAFVTVTVDAGETSVVFSRVTLEPEGGGSSDRVETIEGRATCSRVGVP